ncbi:hypothetical protein BpHYR1_002324 [Brachionus plicatilis]|uniref:Uncharacterized protein n=1 Tax=Brachionus plicatilis TaxID=10195 RepID=A0A3M7SYL1_BRAPC|nr:hypothetical protein BpHYR1_002324 [Brachionus plicatilis]
MISFSCKNLTKSVIHKTLECLFMITSELYCLLVRIIENRTRSATVYLNSVMIYNISKNLLRKPLGFEIKRERGICIKIAHNQNSIMNQYFYEQKITAWTIKFPLGLQLHLNFNFIRSRSIVKFKICEKKIVQFVQIRRQTIRLVKLTCIKLFRFFLSGSYLKQWENYEQSIKIFKSDEIQDHILTNNIKY